MRIASLSLALMGCSIAPTAPAVSAAAERVVPSAEVDRCAHAAVVPRRGTWSADREVPQEDRRALCAALLPHASEPAELTHATYLLTASGAVRGDVAELNFRLPGRLQGRAGVVLRGGLTSRGWIFVDERATLDDVELRGVSHDTAVRVVDAVIAEPTLHVATTPGGCDTPDAEPLRYIESVGTDYGDKAVTLPLLCPTELVSDTMVVYVDDGRIVRTRRVVRFVPAP